MRSQEINRCFPQVRRNVPKARELRSQIWRGASSFTLDGGAVASLVRLASESLGECVRVADYHEMVPARLKAEAPIQAL